MGFGRYRFRRSFGNVGSTFRGARPDTYPLYTGVLDSYPGAAAAYSLRALSRGWLAGDVVEVRRDSDSTSQDFTASQITNGSMLDWVNEPFSVYTSDFSVNVDGFTTTANGTTSGNQSIGGVNDALKFTVGGAGGAAQFLRSSGFSGNGDKNIRIQFDVYIPSQIYVDTIRITDNKGGNYVNVTPLADTWVSVDETFTAASGSNRITFRCYDGLSGNINALASGEEVYIKNISVDYIDANGFVSTWYDQSGNANDITQATTTSQPKIVDDGALVANGIDFYSNSILESAAFADGTSSSVFMAFNNQAADANRKIFFSKSTFPDDGIVFNYRGDASVGEYDFVNYDGFNHALTYSETTSPLLGLSTTIINGTGKEAFLNGASRASSSDVFVGGNTYVRLGNPGFGTGFEIAEVILYPTDESANRVGIETNINDYYSIY